MKIKKALGKNIVVRYLEPAKEVSCLLIPESARKSLSVGDCLRAVVISVGSKVKFELKPGQIALVNKRLGTRLPDDLAVYDPEDVYAIEGELYANLQ